MNYKSKVRADVVGPGQGGKSVLKKVSMVSRAKTVAGDESSDLARKIAVESDHALRGKMEIMRMEFPFTVVNAIVFLLGGFGSFWISATTTGSNETTLFVWKGIGIFVGFVGVWWITSQVTGKAFGAWGKAITLIIVLGFFAAITNLGPVFGVVQVLVLLIVGGIGFFAYKAGVIKKILVGLAGRAENFGFMLGSRIFAPSPKRKVKKK